MNGFRNATRVMNGLTARVEKRALIWMAERLPAAIHSDHLTGLAALAMLAGAGCYVWSRQWTPASSDVKTGGWV